MTRVVWERNTSSGQEFGVSHIPVREALTRLTEEGIVERLPPTA